VLRWKIGDDERRRPTSILSDDDAQSTVVLRRLFPGNQRHSMSPGESNHDNYHDEVARIRDAIADSSWYGGGVEEEASEWWRRREADRCLLSTLADIIFTDPSSRPGRALGRLSVCVCVVRVSGPWLRNETISDLDIWLADTCWPFLSILVDQVGMSKL